MKAYRIAHDPASHVTTVTWPDILGAEALGRAIAEIDTPETQPFVLWDFSAVRQVTLSLGQVQTLARALREQSSRLRPAGKTAVLAPNDLLFGLARQAHAFALLISSDPPIEIFRDIESAMRWLNVPRSTAN